MVKYALHMTTRSLALPPRVRFEWCAAGISDDLWSDSLTEVRVTADAPPSYVGPVAQAMLAAWGARLRTRDVAVEIDDSVKSRWAWQSGLLSALAGRSDAWAKQGTTWVRAHLESEPQIEETLHQVLRVMGLADADAAKAVSYFLSELLRNVFEHSGSAEGGFVTAGRFQSGRVTLAVVDLGMTVAGHVSQRWKGPVEPERALQMALEPFVSGSRDRRRNAGLGLYMTRRISTLMGGRFWLRSGGLVTRAKAAAEAGARQPAIITAGDSTWPGTAVAVTFQPGRDARFDVELRQAQSEFKGGANGARRDVFRKKLPPGAVAIRVAADVGTLAQDKPAATRIRETEILPRLAGDDTSVVAIDVRGVTLTTQSFVHALLAEPIRVLGIAGVDARLRVVGADAQVKEVVRIVLGYVLDEGS